MLGPLDAVNGILMLGMTGAALMAILQQLITVQRDALAPLSACLLNRDRSFPAWHWYIRA